MPDEQGSSHSTVLIYILYPWVASILDGQTKHMEHLLNNIKPQKIKHLSMWYKQLTFKGLLKGCRLWRAWGWKGPVPKCKWDLHWWKEGRRGCQCTFVHSKYLLSTFHMSGSVLGSRKTAISDTEQVATLWELREHCREGQPLKEGMRRAFRPIPRNKTSLKCLTNKSHCWPYGHSGFPTMTNTQSGCHRKFRNFSCTVLQICSTVYKAP